MLVVDAGLAEVVEGAYERCRQTRKLRDAAEEPAALPRTLLQRHTSETPAGDPGQRHGRRRRGVRRKLVCEPVEGEHVEVGDAPQPARELQRQAARQGAGADDDRDARQRVAALGSAHLVRKRILQESERTFEQRSQSNLAM
jgi:hypothetical protein